MWRVLGLTAAIMFMTAQPLPADSTAHSATNLPADISQEEAERVAKGLLDVALKDPYSAKVQWLQIQDKPFRLRPLAKKVPGQVLRALVNSKNSYGAYGGVKPYDFCFYKGQLIFMVYEAPSGLHEQFPNPDYQSR